MSDVLPGGGWQAVFDDGGTLAVLPVAFFVRKDDEILPFVPNGLDVGKKMVPAETVGDFVGLAAPEEDVRAMWKEWEDLARKAKR